VSRRTLEPTLEIADRPGAQSGTLSQLFLRQLFRTAEPTQDIAESWGIVAGHYHPR
jgi:hypothetical protein